MGRTGSKVTHHCPGQRYPIGGISAGGCVRDKKIGHCKKHQMPCKRHPGWYHLITDDGCNKCVQEQLAAERKAKAEKEAANKNGGKKK